MNGRKLNPDVAIRTLAAKKVNFTNTGSIDLTKAEPLGNKKLGKIGLSYKALWYEVRYQRLAIVPQTVFKLNQPWNQAI